MAKTTECKYCGRQIDNRTIKAHENAHVKNGDTYNPTDVNDIVVTKPFSERFKEAKAVVEAKVGIALAEIVPLIEEVEKFSPNEDQPDADENKNMPFDLEVFGSKVHPATYNYARRAAVVELRKQGLGYRKIAQELGDGSRPAKVRSICKELGI